MNSYIRVLNTTVHRSHAVAYGAAANAQLMQSEIKLHSERSFLKSYNISWSSYLFGLKESDYFVDKMELNDSSSISFGIEMSNGDMNLRVRDLANMGLAGKL